MGSRGSSTAKSYTKEEKDKLKATAKSLREKAYSYVQDGEVTDLDKFLEASKAMIDAEYNAFKAIGNMSEQGLAKVKERIGNSVTELTPKEINIVRTDMLKNKDVYTAIAEAQLGVFVNEDTAVDKLYNSTKGKKLYDTFKNTRKMLTDKYGEELTLYRAGTGQTPKSTINMTTNKKNAQKYSDVYGTKVVATKVKVKDILAVNVSRSGGYEEVIVLNKSGKLDKKKK